MASRFNLRTLQPLADSAYWKDVGRKIFGMLPIVNHRTGNHFLRRPLLGPRLGQWYPEAISRKENPEYTDKFVDFQAKKLLKLRRRGKGPPKKGAGKRASKKK